MCLFSLSVDRVTNTQIFARSTGDKQILVYSMSLVAPTDVAMILPLPVPPGSDAAVVRFISLQGYPRFFADLYDAFWVPPFEDGNSIMLGGLRPAPLAVHRVGLFEASFVPSIDDFRRLDPRFRLSDTVWKLLPQYQDWGFAVFKLQPNARLQEIHPMAFEFPRRDPDQLFFPTVHVHRQRFHHQAHYDHTLYAQLDREQTIDRSGLEWDEPQKPIATVMDFARAAGVIVPQHPVYRRRMLGTYPNHDVVLALGPTRLG